jgi:signal peptidase II
MLVRARVQHEMFLGQAIPIIPGLFNLPYLRNPGAAFSFLATTPEEFRVPFFIAVTVLALAALTIMYIREVHEGLLTRISLVSVAGGAMSNLVERLLAGDVVDYLDVHVGPYHWPTFNLADTAISVWVSLILLEILWGQRATVYVFNVGQPADLVRYAAEASLRETVGLRAIDELLTMDKEAIQDETRQQLQARLDSSLAGLEVLAVRLTEASPPEEVASAREDRATFINEVQAYLNEILLKARGAAARQLLEAESYKAEKVANAAGEAQRFASRLVAYKNATAVTRTRLYADGQ